MADIAETDRAYAADWGPEVAWDEGSVEYWQQFGRKLQNEQEQEVARRASTTASQKDDPSVPTWQPPVGELWEGWWPQDLRDDSPDSWFWYWQGEAWCQRPSPARRESLGGMASFKTKAAKIAKAGIYDLRIHHGEIVWPLLRHWGVFERQGLDAEAEQARKDLSGFLDGLDAYARHYEDKRAARREREQARAS